MYYRINAIQCLHFCQSPPPFRGPSKRGCVIRERCISKTKTKEIGIRDDGALVSLLLCALTRKTVKCRVEFVKLFRTGPTKV